MNCNETQHLFDAYLDGELGSALRTELLAHALSCPTCQHQLMALESALDVVANDHSEPPLDRHFTDRLMEQLPSSEPAVIPMRRAGRSSVILRLGSITAAAAAIVFAVLLAWPAMTHKPDSVKMAEGPRPVIAPYVEYNPLYNGLLEPVVDEARQGLQETYLATADLATAGRSALSNANQTLLATLVGSGHSTSHATDGYGARR